ncbi:MAG: hypothetical protein WCJ59_03070, partial [bacterium]
EVYKLADKLLKGSVLIVVNNLEATDKALIAKNKVEKMLCRFIDLNFNRLPKYLLTIKSDNRYEIKRAKELLPIWESFDVALDIHSTTQDNPPMIIASNNLDFELVKDFPIKTVITNIVDIQLGAPAFAFYGGNKVIQTIEIESGQHNKTKTREVATKCVLSLLNKLKMINVGVSKIKTVKTFDEYYVDDSIIFDSTDDELARPFTDFECIKKGELLALVNNVKVFAKEDCCVLMAPKGKKPSRIGEEAVFLSKPVIKKNIMI